MSTHTEDHLAEQPAIQLMEIELGWEVGGGWNIELRTLNVELRSEEKRKKRLRSALQRLNPDLPVDHSSPTILRQGYERQGLRTAGATNGRGYEWQGRLRGRRRRGDFEC